MYFFIIQGLVVPVLRNVGSMNYADIEKGIAALGEKAKHNLWREPCQKDKKPTSIVHLRSIEIRRSESIEIR